MRKVYIFFSEKILNQHTIDTIYIFSFTVVKQRIFDNSGTETFFKVLNEGSWSDSRLQTFRRQFHYDLVKL